MLVIIFSEFIEMIIAVPMFMCDKIALGLREKYLIIFEDEVGKLIKIVFVRVIIKYITGG